MRVTCSPLRRQTTLRRYACRSRRDAVTAPLAGARRARRTGSHTSSSPLDAPAIHPIFAESTGRRTAVWRRLITITEVATLSLLLSASAAHAETVQMLALAGSVDDVLTNIRNWVMGILAGLATVFLSIGGVRYVMGGGDPGEIEKAKVAFKAAGIGYALAALAPLVVTVLKGIVGA